MLDENSAACDARDGVGNQRALTGLGGHLGFRWDGELVHWYGEMSRVRVG